MTLLFPLFSFICGLVLASTVLASSLKSFFSSILARGFIPIVIIYNMVFYREGSLSLMLLSLFSAILLFGIYYLLAQDRLQALCFSYTNIAWLGFPVAIALFGPEVSAAMIALYIGGSLFGNVWAVTAVSSEAQPFSEIFKKVIQSPPVIALLIAILFRSVGLQDLEQHQWIDMLYSVSKWGMSFTGMCVLGMWLRHTRVSIQDLINSSKTAIFKMCCGAVICVLVYFLFPIPNLEHAIAVLFLLFCLPPAANIVALETHYQGTGTSAKYIAAGTMVSCVIITLYAVVLHFLNESNII